MDVTAAFKVGSGTGANSGEWFEGTSVAGRRPSRSFSGSEPPTQKMQAGIFGSTRL